MHPAPTLAAEADVGPDAAQNVPMGLGVTASVLSPRVVAIISVSAQLRYLPRHSRSPLRPKSYQIRA